MSWNDTWTHSSSSKKGHDKRSRSYKNKRKLYASMRSNQPKITNYYNYLNEIEKLALENKELRDWLHSLLNQTTNQTTNQNHIPRDENTSQVLKLLMKSAEKNSKKSDKKSHGFRYDETLKSFASLIYMLGGRMCYRLLEKNLPFPALPTVSRYVQANGPTIREGELRCDELKKYLEDRKLEPLVWISEDATRITGRIQYDSATNELIGFVLPLSSNGMPLRGIYPARSAKEIEDHFKGNATVANQVIKFLLYNKQCLYYFLNYFAGICNYGAAS